MYYTYITNSGVEEIINKIFSIGYQDNHKVVNLLGIRFAFSIKLKNIKNIAQYNNFVLNKLRLKFKDSNHRPKVAIIIYHRAHWSIDSVYKEMEKCNFDISIILSPALDIKEELREKELEDNYQFFAKMGYNVIKGYDFNSKTAYKINKDLPDILIYQTHWMKDILPEFNILNFYDKILCISIPYGFMIANICQEQFNQQFHNLVWLNCEETTVHKKMAEKYASNKGINAVATGYPKMDKLFDNSAIENYWKINSPSVKKIIWAPHYSINTDWDINSANFHKYYNEFYEYVLNNKNIEMILKPHPMLKSRCIQCKIMTAKEYDEYTEKWNNLPNGKVVTDGNYLDVFKTSDGMILDSLSFVPEYLFTKKPICFINKFSNKDELMEHFNDFGRLAIKQTYLVNNWTGIVEFIKDIVVKNDDVMQAQREEFYNKYLKVNEGNSGKYIVEYIKKELELR